MKFPKFLNKLLAAIVPQKDEAATETKIELSTDSNNHSLITTKTSINMAMYNYGVGGNEVKVDANEAINEIQHNKTMLISQLTSNEPVQPETVQGLKTVEDVFRYFNPNVDIEMESSDGEAVKENLRFSNLGDFAPKNIVSQSRFLHNLDLQQDQYAKIMKQLKSNKVLQAMLANEETKGAMLEALKQMAQELEKAA